MCSSDLEWLARRAAMDNEAVAAAILPRSGIGELLVDTGYRGPLLTSPDELGRLAGAPAREVVRLEVIAEEVAAAEVTAAGYADLVRAQAPGVTVLEEPVGRNTAAAIALATVALERDDDEVMVVLPADQTIDREADFRAVIGAAAGGLARGAFGIASPLVTLGITPDQPATGYGYIRQGEALRGLEGVSRVAAFVEKPNEDIARRYVAEGYLWNSGKIGRAHV